MHSRTVIAALVAAGLMTAVHAQAQDTPRQDPDPRAAPAQQDPDDTLSPLPREPEGLTLTPFVDIGFSGDYENSPAGFGAALGYGLTERVSIEGDVSFTPDGEQGLAGEVESSVWSLSGNVLYHFFTEDVTPYVTVGLGMLGAHTDADELGLVDDDTDYELAWNWGGGFKSVVSERFGIRGDLRYFAGDDLAPDHWRLYGGVMIRGLGR